MESVQSEDVPFGGHNQEVPRTTNGEPQTNEQFHIPEIISFIHSEVENLTDSHAQLGGSLAGLTLLKVTRCQQ